MHGGTASFHAKARSNEESIRLGAERQTMLFHRAC